MVKWKLFEEIHKSNLPKKTTADGESAAVARVYIFPNSCNKGEIELSPKGLLEYKSIDKT